MKRTLLVKFSLSCMLSSLLSVVFLSAQPSSLNKVFDQVFRNILGDESGEGGALTPVPILDADGNEIANHAKHFKDASTEASRDLTPALNRLIAGNLSSFPLSSTNAGVTVDWSSGQPVSLKESLGPIFAETGKTLGYKKVNIGLNYTSVNLSRIRGLRTSDMRFTFNHEDVKKDGKPLGDSPNESDVLDINLNLNIQAQIFAFYVTVGVTENFDIGVAIPLVNVSMSGEAKATISSFTYASTGSPNHHFGTEPNKSLEHIERFNENALGQGDLSLRFKYSILQKSDIHIAALLDARINTGNDEDFLGLGQTNTRFSGIFSKNIKDFTAHLNFGYDYRPADNDSDEFEFAAGFDQKIVPGLTFAVDFLGEIDLNKNEAVKLFPGTVEIDDQGDELPPRILNKSNIPERDNDDILNVALGFRFAPNEKVLFLGNVLIPVNDGGLRPAVAPTFGFAVSL